MAESLGFSSKRKTNMVSRSPSISTWSWFFHINIQMAIYYNTPAKTKETMTEVGNRKKTDKILFHKNVTPGTLQRSFFKIKKCLFRCSLYQVLVWMSLGLQNSTNSCRKSKAQMSLWVSQSLSLFFLFCPSLAFPTLLCRVCEEHCQRALVEWVVTGWSSFSLYCSLDQYWDMSGSLPGTWTGTDTPGEMSPIETRSERCQMIGGAKST